VESKDIDSLTDIIASYGIFVAKNQEKLPYGISESLLPHPKEAIQDAIEKVYLVCKSLHKKNNSDEIKNYLEMLELSYEYLGYFLPPSEIEFQGKPTAGEKEAFIIYEAKLLKRQKDYAAKLQEAKERAK